MTRITHPLPAKGGRVIEPPPPPPAGRPTKPAAPPSDKSGPDVV
jgi:hypothetical protein